MNPRKLSLPEEILVMILLIDDLDVLDILNCSAVSKAFNRIVRSNHSIQYIIELAVAGLTPTKRLDAEVSLPERIRRLKECVSRTTPEPYSPSKERTLTEKKNIVSGRRASCRAIVGGVLARYFRARVAGGEAARDEAAYVEVKNFYSETKPDFENVQTFSWKCTSSFDSIWIDPSADVLFGFSGIDESGTQLSVLQLSTGVPHSQTLKDTIPILAACPSCIDAGPSRTEAQVIGHVLGIHCCPRGYSYSNISIVDWTKGIITSVFPDMRQASQWCLASEDLLLVMEPPSEFRPYFSANLYSLQNTGLTTEASPTHLATFLFPELHSRPLEPKPFLSLRTSPPVVPTSLYPDNIHDFVHCSDPSARLAVIQFRQGMPMSDTLSFISPITTFTNYGKHLKSSDGPTQVDADDQAPAPVTISWDSWGPSNTRCFPIQYDMRLTALTSSAILLDGFQVLSEHYGVMDFNPLRIRRHISRLSNSVIGNPKTTTTGLISTARFAELRPGEEAFVDRVTTSLAYTRGSLSGTLHPLGFKFPWRVRKYHQGTLFTIYDLLGHESEHISIASVRPSDDGDGH